MNGEIKIDKKLEAKVARSCVTKLPDTPSKGCNRIDWSHLVRDWRPRRAAHFKLVRLDRFLCEPFELSSAAPPCVV